MSNPPTPSSGRLSGSKSPSYVRAVNEPESRASRYTARYMLAGDIAYVLSAAPLGQQEIGGTKYYVATVTVQARIG